MFTRIVNIEDVLPHFHGRTEFTIGKRDGFTFIDYNYILPDTFDDPVRLEGRGIKFCNKTGAVLARPFHKFFNLNERNGSRFDDLPWDVPYIVQEKSDGSMIHPVMLGGEIVLMTRKGISDTAIQAQKECDVPYDEMRRYIDDGMTPIYEYVSPNNRIVINYEHPELRLLALRDNLTGRYLYPENVHGLRQVKKGAHSELVNAVRKTTGEEGVVITWFNGHKVKLKGEEYVQLHRAVDTMSSEKRILDVVLDGKDDDLCSMISEDRAEKIRNYAVEVRQIISNVQKTVEILVKNNSELSQKEFALKINDPNFSYRRYAPELFRVRSGKLDSGDIGVSYIKRHSGTQKELDTFRDVLGIPKLGNLAFNNEEN